MSRHLKILEYALGALLRRRWRHLALLAVYALVVAAVASVLLFAGGLRAEAERLLAGAPEIVVQRLAAGRHDAIPEGHAAAIAAIPGVAVVRPRVWGYHYDPLVKANYTVTAPLDAAPGGALPGLAGRLPAGPGEAAVGAGVAAARRLRPGDDLILVDARGTGRVLVVTGVFGASSALVTNDLLVLDPGELRDFFALPPGHATDLAVGVRNPREVATVAAKVRARLPDTRPVTREDLRRTYRAVFDWRSGMLLAALLPALAAFAILVFDRASGLPAEERRELGVLKAVGWTTGDVLLLKLWEGLVVSGLALALGLLLAQAHLVLFGGALVARLLRGWSVLFPAFPVAALPDGGTLLALALLTAGPYLAATVVPSWRAAVTDPDAALRG